MIADDSDNGAHGHDSDPADLERLAAAEPSGRDAKGCFVEGNKLGKHFPPGHKTPAPFTSDNPLQMAANEKQRRGRTSRQARFLRAYREHGTVHKAAEVAGVSSSCHHQWLRAFPRYAELFKSVHDGVMDRFEAVFINRALKGVENVEGRTIPHSYLMAFLNNRHKDYDRDGKTAPTVNITYQSTVLQGADLDLITGEKRHPAIDVEVTQPPALPEPDDAA